MSVKVKYKGEEIASASTEVTKTIKTAGKYCEADILVENTPDGGDAPVINPLSVTENGTYSAPEGVDGYSPVTVNVPQGITPSGKITITENGTDIDVSQYALADVNVSGGGGVDYLQFATGLRFERDYPSENPDVYAPICKDFDHAFCDLAETSSTKYKTIKIKSDVQITTINRAFYNNTALTSVTIDCDTSKITDFSDWLTFDNALTGIYGTPLSFKSTSRNQNLVSSLNNITARDFYVRYAPNTISRSHFISRIHYFSDDSIVSIANGLKLANSGLIITMASETKAQIQSIMGTVSQVTDGDVTYDFFTADASGSVTLENFITQTKGWTIA